MKNFLKEGSTNRTNQIKAVSKSELIIVRTQRIGTCLFRIIIENNAKITGRMRKRINFFLS